MSQDNDGRDITDLPPSASHVGDMTDFGEIKAGGWAILSSDEASNALKTKENEDVNDGGEGDEDEVNNDKNDTRDNSGDNGKEDNGKGEKDDVDNKESKKKVKTKIYRRQFDPRKSHLLSARYCMLHLLNAHLTRCINQMDLSRMLTIRLSSTLGTSINEAWNAIDRNALIRPDHSVIQSLGGLLRSNRSFILSSVTNPIVTQSIAKTEYQGSKFDLVLSRPRAAKFINLGECDTNGRWSCFGLAFRAMHGMPCSNLRRSSALWETVFAGERAQDAGGPYREAWSAFTQELMSPHNVLPLFRLSPNGVNNVGTYCESMVLNPTATTRTQMEMFAFLGKLFGVAARSKNYLDLSLNPLAWKLIAQETVTPDDIRDVDILTMRWLDKVQSPDIMPEELAEVNFTSVDFAGNVVEIHKNGADDYIAPGSGDVDRYVREVIDFKLYEMMPAANAIRAGLETQIPPSALSLLRASDLEIMVCGIPTVDVELLKSCTEYSGCAITDQHIVWFWEIMEKDFDQADLKAFIKFAWGRSRLPLTKNGFTQLMKLQRFHNSNPDNYLPVSHTCFFSVEVPRYSTKENMRSKFLYAIHNCMAIDGDENNIGTRNGDIASWD